jgi:hypothetical protein
MSVDVNCDIHLIVDVIKLTEIITPVYKRDVAKLAALQTFSKVLWIYPSFLEISKTLKRQTKLHMQIVKRDIP